MKTLFTSLFLMCAAVVLQANNVIISSVDLQNQDTVANYSLISFDASWENSWRTSTNESNWDALWIVAKYRKTNQQLWQHATFHYVDGTGSGDGHQVPAGATIASSNDNGAGGAHGVFLYAANDMAQQTVTYSDVKLRWDYGVDGLEDADSVEICILAMEMVYIPEGSFYMGDGDVAQESFKALHSGSNTNFLVGTTMVNNIQSDAAGGVDDAVITNASNGIGIDGDDGIDIDNDGVVDNADFPTGYKAYYIMKYEVSQGFYAAFLNKVTEDQLTNLYSNTSSFRETISGNYPDFVVSSPSRAMLNLSAVRNLSLADWLAMRPMTEFEFEKACRGNQPSFTFEYAWGNDSLSNNIYTIANDGQENSQVSNVTTRGNAAYNLTNGQLGGVRGPLRAGIFAASAGAPNREETGASYYGVMELSGNLYEITVSVGRAQGRAYNGEHGDGEIASDGTANQSNWMALYSTPSAFLFKGGYWNSVAEDLRVSQRSDWSFYPTSILTSLGARLVRTAPQL